MRQKILAEYLFLKCYQNTFCHTAENKVSRAPILITKYSQSSDI
jgi:hypothetical protein